MERLNETTLPKFVKAPGLAVVLIGAADDEATMKQAWEFAVLWAETKAGDLDDIRFGYVDGDACPSARRYLDVANLPTTLVIRSGVMEICFECVINRQVILSALRTAPWRSGQIARHLVSEVRHDEAA